MVHVAGVDGTPGGWAVINMGNEQTVIRKMSAASDLVEIASHVDIMAIGGRTCDRAARTRNNSASAATPLPTNQGPHILGSW
jgi:hypothetical protein